MLEAEIAKETDSDLKTGLKIVAKSLEYPAKQIAQNAGVDGSIIVDKVRHSTESNYGYNALTDKFEDMLKAGIVDPAKVTRAALQNAASIAAMLLTTEALVVDKPEKKSGGGMPGGMGGMDPGMMGM